MTENDADLKNSNLAFFKEFAPEIHARLTEIPRTSTHIPLTPGDIPTVRFTIPAPEPESLDTYTFNFLDEALRRAKDEKITMVDWPRADDSYFLATLGVQHHIPLYRLIERTQCMAWLIIEPDLDALWWSFDHVNWKALINEVQGRGGIVDFIFYDDVERLSAILWRTLRSINPTCSDGATFATHGHADLANKLIERLASEFALSYSSLGFFHDETLMIRNAYHNLMERDGRIFERRFEKPVDCPVFVVASGPSLDDSIATIKQHAGDVVIVSCGSALRPLLINGITPDFQIETENILVSPLTRQLVREFDLSKLTLVAATTIESSVLDAFREIIFYFRAPLSAYPLFAPSNKSTLFMPDPTVGNAGVSFALELGFTDVFLFGVDCGSKARDQHHSKDTFHYTEEAGDVDISYGMSVEANFGGTSWTNYGLLASLSNFVELLSVFGSGRTIYNCSDGALIAGAEPLRLADLKLPLGDFDKDKTVRELIDGMPSFLGGEQKFEWMGQAFSETITGYGELVRERIASIEDFKRKDYQLRLMELYQPMIGYFVPPPKGINHCVNIMMRGTSFAMLLFMERYLSRVAYDTDVNRFGEICMEVFEQTLATIERDAIERLGGAEPLPPPPYDSIRPLAGSKLPTPPAPPRTAPCPCGSMKKFKHCHGASG